MVWINYLIFLVLGGVSGFFIASYKNKKTASGRDLSKELEKSRYELEQHRQELIEHFSRSASLIDAIDKDQAKLSQYMTKTLTKLIPDLPEQDNPFSKKTPD